MKKILALTFCAALGLRLCAQNSPAPMRLAIVSESTDTMAAADLLTAELSKNDRVQLLERSEIEKVIREQQLSLINLDCLKLGRLLGADGLLALQSVTEGTNVFLNAQLVAVRPGVILTDERFGRPAQDVSAWAANIVGHLEPLLPKLGVLARDAIPLSVVNFHAGVRTAEAAALERQIFYLTVERLVREPRLFVLERRRMQALSVKGSVLTFCTFTFHRAFFRAAASRFETLLQLPMTRRSATHFKVIVVSRRSRPARTTFPLSPLARSRNSASLQPRRRNSSATIRSAFAKSDS